MKNLGFIMITLTLVIISVLGTVKFIIWSIAQALKNRYVDIQFNDPITGRKDISLDEFHEVRKNMLMKIFKRK